MTKRFSIVSNEYLNTGGNCMVNITTVYNKQSKTMQYVYINEEWMIVASYDYIRNICPDDMDYEDFVVASIETQNLTHEPSFDNHQMNDLPEEIADLLFNCLTLFIREWCKHTGNNFCCRLDSLPNELYDQVSREYSHWLAEKELDPVTDGYKIILHPQYIADTKYDTPNGKAASDLQKHLAECLEWKDKDDDSCDEFYNEKLQIIYCGKLFTFYNGADVFNALEELAGMIIDNQ